MTQDKRQAERRACECKSLPGVGINYPCVMTVDGRHPYIKVKNACSTPLAQEWREEANRRATKPEAPRIEPVDPWSFGPRIVPEGTKCAACGNLLSDRQVRINGRCRVCMAPYKPEAPRIVAECWTCNHCFVAIDQPHAQRCRAAGHDVREVTK